MADQQLNIKLNVIDNATKAFTEVKNNIFNLKNALIGIGAGTTLRGILKAGSEAQKLKSQFLQLAPSIDEGTKSFSALQKFISNSPLPADQIEQSASAIFALTKNSTSLIDSLTAIQNASIALNIPLETLAREFNNLSINGIEGTRELKRRGLESILGFTDGVKREPQIAVQEFLKVFGANGKFGLASNAFANTFEGATNRFFNSIKNIKESIAQAGLLDFFTDLTNAITDIIKDNPEQLKEFVNNFAKSTKEIISQFLGFADTIIALTKPIFDFTVQAFKDLYAFIQLFPKEVQEIGIIGFLLLGKKGKVALLAGASIFGKIKSSLEELGLISKENSNNIQEQNEGLFNQFNITDKIKQKEKERIENQNQYLEAQKAINNLKEKESNLLDQIIERFKIINGESIKELQKTSEIVVQTLNQGIKDFSKGIAESIVLGKSLGEAFKSAVQNALVRILSTQIEIIIREGIKLSIQKLQTAEIIKQNALLSQQQLMGAGDGRGGGFFGSLLKIGASFFGGGGGMSSSASAYGQGYSFGGLAEGGSVRGGMPITVGERGRELFIPQTDGTIVPNQDMGRGQNITFNIQANDVRGIKELLIDNRATIINLVNQGANQKGKSNVV